MRDERHGRLLGTIGVGEVARSVTDPAAKSVVIDKALDSKPKCLGVLRRREQSGLFITDIVVNPDRVSDHLGFAQMHAANQRDVPIRCPVVAKWHDSDVCIPYKRPCFGRWEIDEDLYVSRDAYVGQAVRPYNEDKVERRKTAGGCTQRRIVSRLPPERDHITLVDSP